MVALCSPRLLELTPSYFDIGSFPCGETNRASHRLLNKESGKAEGRCPKTPNGEIRPARKSRSDEEGAVTRVQHPLSLSHILSATMHYNYVAHLSMPDDFQCCVVPGTSQRMSVRKLSNGGPPR